MTANLTLTPKKTVTTAMLVVIGTVALAYVTLQLPKPAADTGWRHEAAVAAPALSTAPTEMRARELDASAMTPAGEISIARGRN